MQTHPATHGFSLLEVMISVSIFSIGLLGLLQLQARSLQHVYSAMLTSLAANQLVNIADQFMVTTSPDITEWNHENNHILPQGEGQLVYTILNYRLALAWFYQEQSYTLTLQGIK
jgi:type IV pilus assembly protein PilV